MLVLARGTGESVMVSDDFIITVEDIADSQVLVAIIQRGLGGRMTSADEVVARKWLLNREPIAFKRDCSVEMVDVRGDRVRLGFRVPPNTSVHRREIYEAIVRENARAAASEPRRNAAEALHDRIAFALMIKFGKGVDLVIDDIRQINDIDMLKRVADAVESAATLDDVRRIWSGGK